MDSPILSECIGKDFRVEGYSTRRSDTWALGVVLVNMITGLCPWGKATSDDIRFCEYMLDSSYLERNLPVSRGVVRILSRVFRINPRSRPTLEQLRESIVAVDSLFPPARVPLRPESPDAPGRYIPFFSFPSCAGVPCGSPCSVLSRMCRSLPSTICSISNPYACLSASARRNGIGLGFQVRRISTTD